MLSLYVRLGVLLLCATTVLPAGRAATSSANVHSKREWKTEGEMDRGTPRTSFGIQRISDAGLPSYTELKRLAENREEWRAQVQLQN